MSVLGCRWKLLRITKTSAVIRGFQMIYERKIKIVTAKTIVDQPNHSSVIL